MRKYQKIKQIIIKKSKISLKYDLVNNIINDKCALHRF